MHFFIYGNQKSMRLNLDVRPPLLISNQPQSLFGADGLINFYLFLTSCKWILHAWFDLYVCSVYCVTQIMQKTFNNNMEPHIS